MELSFTEMAKRRGEVAGTGKENSSSVFRRSMMEASGRLSSEDVK